MYICICNSLREEDCHEALACGVSDAANIYAHHGCMVKCGRCMEEMEQMVMRHSITVQQAHFSASESAL